MNSIKIFFLLLLCMGSIEVGAQTKILSRLVASSKYTYSGTEYKMSDTETFVYGLGRGGDDYYSLPYDYSLSLKARSSSGLDSNVRNEKTYNTSNKVLTHKQQIWTNASIGWMNTIGISYNYDWMNNETEQTVQRWDNVTNTWKNQDLITKIYDAKNHLIEQTTQEWNNSAGAWQNKNRFIYSYDIKNRITNIVSIEWDGIKWTNKTQDSYVFDTNDDLVEKVNFKWNKGTSNWDSSEKTETVYSSTHKKLLETNSGYIAGAWQAQTIYEYLYDSNDSIEVFKYKNWDPSASKWSNQTKAKYYYSTTGQLILLTSQKGLNDTGWQNFWKRDYEYDLATNSVSQVHASWNMTRNDYDSGSKTTMSYNLHQQITKYVWEFWVSSAKKFIPHEINNYYYEEYTASIQNTNPQKDIIQLYPIPAQNILQLEVYWGKTKNCHIAIYDIGGRVMKTWPIRQQKGFKEAIDLNDYSDGQYLVVVIAENGEKLSKSFVIHR